MADTGPIGPANQAIKRLRRLSGRRSSRRDEGCFVVEGPTLVAEAVRSGVAIDAVFVDEERLDLVADCGRWRGDATLVSAGVLGSVLSSISPQPVCAIAKIPSHWADGGETQIEGRIAEVVNVALERERPILVLCDVADPGNAGTLLRAAEASGCSAVVLVGECVDVYNPKVVRASAGSLFRMELVSEMDAILGLHSLAAAGIPVLASVVRGGAQHVRTDLSGAVAIVVGNEARGLSEPQVAACTRGVTIEMAGSSESLNVAMAGTILCFEALRQRSDAAESSEWGSVLGHNGGHD